MVEFRGGCIVNDTDVDEPVIFDDGWYYTAAEFAELMGVPESTVRVWVKRRIVSSVSYYGRLYIPVNTSWGHQYPWMNARKRKKMGLLKL